MASQHRLVRLLAAGLVTTLVATLAATIGPGPATAAPLGAFSCMPANSLQNSNAPATLMAGRLLLPGHPAITIGTTGQVNWALNPYHDTSWVTYYLSLKWLESLTRAYQRTGQQVYLDRALAITYSFVRAVPPGLGPNPASAWNGMYAGQRTTVLTCLDSLRPGLGWLQTAIVNHGLWLAAPAHDPGDWNQGVDAAIGLLGAACRTGRSAWASTALVRFNRMIAATIDAQGAIGEQAPYYGQYLYGRWGIAASKIAECGLLVPTAIATRRAMLVDFLAWSTEPNGNAVQLGDSVATPFLAVPGTSLEYVVTRGVSGTAPAAPSRVYSAGYAFGRSTWDPFASATYYSLRFGRGRAYHGHDDHTSMTWYALGHPLLVDSGHFGYTAGAYRNFLRSPQAHNVLVLPGVAFNTAAPTVLRRQTTTSTWQSYTLTDTAWAGRTRSRDVLFDTSADVLVTYDRATRATVGGLQQLWHLPVGSVATLSGRSRATVRTSDAKVQLVLLQVPLPGQVLPAGAIGVVAGRTAPYQGWVSTGLNRKQVAPVVTMARSGTSAAILTVAAAVPFGTPVTASAVRGAAGGYVLRVVAGSRVTLVQMTAAGVLTEL